MPATDTTLWDYAVTYGGPSLFMTAVFLTVMPLVWFKLVRPRLKNWPSRLAVMLAVWMTAWFIAYGDVLLIAREAKRVCEAEAGLKIYRKVVATGFAGVFDLDPWLKMGFRFTEYRRDNDSFVRQEIIDGRLARTVSTSPKSQYEIVREIVPLSKRLAKDVQAVRGIVSGERLSEFVQIRTYPGWADRLLIGFLGGRSRPSYCPGIERSGTVSSEAQLIGETLLPSVNGNHAH